MAKQATTKAKASEQEALANESMTTKAAEIAEPKKKAEPAWEIKDRTYLLTGNKSPLTYTIQTRHTRKKPLLWFNEETGEQKEIRYATNQNSIFVDEQQGHATLGHVLFTDGVLRVPRSNQPLQKLMSLYHPKAGKTWREHNPVKIAEDELDIFELKFEAQSLIHELDVDHLEAVMRTEMGSRAANATAKELRRDAFRLANSNPKLFIDLVKDEDLQLRNTGIKAVERGILQLTENNTKFLWGGTDRKVMTVPFDENPYSALAKFFKTDDGVSVLKSIEKKL